MNMTKQDVAAFHKEVQASLDALTKKYGLRISKSNIRYSDVGLKLVVEAGNTAVTGDLPVEWVNGLRKCGHIYGLSVKDLNAHVVVDGVGGTIAGMNKKNTVVLKLDRSPRPDKPYRAVAAHAVAAALKPQSLTA